MQAREIERKKDRKNERNRLCKSRETDREREGG